MSNHFDRKYFGSVGRYIEYCRSSSIVSPTFDMPKDYKTLWNAGYITPEITVVRLMFKLGGPDEFYGVNKKYELEGMKLPEHSGRDGKHDPRVLLKNEQIKCWLVENINSNPRKRKDKFSMKI